MDSLGEIDDNFNSLDSDSNMITASEGYASSSPVNTQSQTQTEILSGNCNTQSILPEKCKSDMLSSVQAQENANDCVERDILDKRGDADGCSIDNSDESNPKVSELETELDAAIETGLKELTISQDENGELRNIEGSKEACLCKRTDSHTLEENGTALQGVWHELRSSIRHLYKTVLPSQNKSNGSTSRNRPSVSRVRALSNMLFNHDPHQLFTRVCQLSQEFCIELKVRLLSTIHDSPDLDEASSFIQGLCESYQFVMNACETVQSAFEKLDSEHLTNFGLNWITVNMHTFYTTVFTDIDVQDYINICTTKAGDSLLGEEALGCLASLKRTLAAAESIWSRAESHLQEYVMERAAMSVQRRQLISDWDHLKSNHVGKYSSQKQVNGNHSSNGDAKNDSNSSGNKSTEFCACPDCQLEHEVNHRDFTSPVVSKEFLVKRSSSPSGCECHFCNSAPYQSQSGNVLSTAGGVLPPLTQPQLSLYPHIHGTVAVSDIVHAGEDLTTTVPNSKAKPPLFSNPYLGSDLLTEQLIQEWDLTYGDALSLPGSSLPSIANGSTDVPSGLINGIEDLNITSRPSYVHQMVDHSFSLMQEGSGTSSPSIDSVNIINSVSSKTSVTLSSSCCHSGNSLVTSTACSVPASRVNSFPQGHPQTSLSHTKAGESVITHTKSYQASLQKGHPITENKFSDDVLTHSDENSITPSEIETSGHDEWSSGDETDDTSDTSSGRHQDSHCDCCICHMLQNKASGGRQKYSDRRERLLKILSRKKKAVNSSSSSSNTSTTKITCKNDLLDHDASQKTLDELINYIEGRLETNDCSRSKKAVKRAKQKEKKVALRKQLVTKCSRLKQDQCPEKDDESDDITKEKEEDEAEEEITQDEDEEEDGPLAELRRRAPDVTITVVKPGQKQASQPSRVPQMSITRDTTNSPQEGSKHPLASKPQNQIPHNIPPRKNDSWNPPRPMLPSRVMGSVGMYSGMGNRMTPNMEKPFGKENSKLAPSESKNRLSNILKTMKNTNESADPDGKGSQMVTIRRVMDPVSAEPTVTITLKGEEPEKDKVLMKLVNGQGVPGKKENQNLKEKPKKVPQEKPVYVIPEGVSAEEAKKIKKLQKKERQRNRKEQEKMEEQKQEEMQQLQLKQQQEFLKQQEKHIKQQQVALQRQQEELIRRKQQSINEQSKKQKGNKKSKKSKTKVKEQPKKKGSSTSVIKDDVSSNFNLPPGVSISKVAGQPGMVTISNNMGGGFPQPFLPNASLFQNSFMNGYPGNSSGFSVSNPAMNYPSLYGGCSSNMPWNGSLDPCNGSPEESVIVVDTKAGATCCNNLGASKKLSKKISEQSSKFASSKLSSRQEKQSQQKQKQKQPQQQTLQKQTQQPKQKQSLPRQKQSQQQPLPKSKQIAQPSSSQNKRKSSPKPIKKLMSRKNFEKLSSEEKVQVAVRAEVDLAFLNQTQKKKYKKALKAQREENEKELAKQREEDDLMDQMYRISKGEYPFLEKNNVQETATTTNNNNQSKSNNNKRQNQTVDKVKGNNKVKEQGKTNDKRSATNTKQKPLTQKLDTQRTQAKCQGQQKLSKQSSQNCQTTSQTKTGLQKQNSSLQKQNQQKQLNNIRPQDLNRHRNTSLKHPIQGKGDAAQHRQQTARLKQQNNPNCQQKQNTQKLPQQKNPKQTNFQKIGLTNNMISNKGTTSLRYQQMGLKPGAANQQPIFQQQSQFRNLLNQQRPSYGQTLGYTNDIGHEARYAQYLAANASTLAAVESNYKANLHAEDEVLLKKKQRKGTKGGTLEDLTTIDSVFAPKDVAGGELDEAEREVEAFKRFCLYNVPRNTGEKPKVNFNVKDILIKKRHHGV